MESNLVAEVGIQLVLAVLCATAVLSANIAFLQSPDSVFGLAQGYPGWHISSFSSDLPGIFLEELQSAQEGIYSSFPHHHSDLSFCPMSSFRTIIPSHVVIQKYSRVPRHHSELFLRPTSSFGTILASHVIIRNYSCAPRRHSEVFSRLTSIRIILAPHVIIRELFFRPTSPFGNNSSVRRHTLFPWSTRARMHAHTYTKKSKINYEL